MEEPGPHQHHSGYSWGTARDLQFEKGQEYRDGLLKQKHTGLDDELLKVRPETLKREIEEFKSKMEAKVAEAEAKAKEAEDKFLRTHADFENIKKAMTEGIKV